MGHARWFIWALPLALAGCGGSQKIEVTYEGATHEVALDAAEPVTIGADLAGARVDELIAKALSLTVSDVAGFQADFIAEDGTKPGSVTECTALVPVDGASLDEGYVETESLKLYWPTLTMPACMSVAKVKTIVVTKK